MINFLAGFWGGIGAALGVVSVVIGVVAAIFLVALSMDLWKFVVLPGLSKLRDAWISRRPPPSAMATVVALSILLPLLGHTAVAWGMGGIPGDFAPAPHRGLPGDFAPVLPTPWPWDNDFYTIPFTPEFGGFPTTPFQGAVTSGVESYYVTIPSLFSYNPSVCQDGRNTWMYFSGICFHGFGMRMVTEDVVITIIDKKYFKVEKKIEAPFLSVIDDDTGNEYAIPLTLIRKGSGPH